MITKGIVGKRIAKVVQRKVRMGAGHAPQNIIEHIELEDGTRLVPQVHEGEDSYGVDMVVMTNATRRRV